MSIERIPIAPHMITWALERAGLDALTLAQSKTFRDIIRWENGELQPTLKQLEKFAKAVHIPIGYLFLPNPLEEKLPIADFRTLAGQKEVPPSPNLLDTVYQCQQRQDWYKNYAKIEDIPPITFVGSATIKDNPVQVAKAMREALDFSLQEQQTLPNWEKALQLFKKKVDDAGILLMANGVVGNNTRRVLQVEEFRGFALSDTVAPLIFINNTDSKAAQMFTLAHELAHIWLGESGVSNAQTGKIPSQKVEVWCNAVAAEFLMPLEATKEAYNNSIDFDEQIQMLARRFKVSTLVVIRRLYDAGFIDKTTLWQKYQMLSNSSKKSTGSGGNFYNTSTTRIGTRFMKAILGQTFAGHTLFRDALNLLGIKKTETLYNQARQLGVIVYE